MNERNCVNLKCIQKPLRAGLV